MIYFVSCFLTGFIATLIVMNVSKRYSHLSADHDLSGAGFGVGEERSLGLSGVLSVGWIASALHPGLSGSAGEWQDTGAGDQG